MVDIQNDPISKAAAHKEQYPMADKTVMISSGPFQGRTYVVEDWWDRIVGRSWMVGQTPAEWNYAAGQSYGKEPPIDNEVVYGNIGGLGYLIHKSMLE